MYISLRNRPKLEGGPPASTLPSRGVPRLVLLLGTVSLLTDISSEMTAAILPMFVTLGLGLSPMIYGVIDGVYQGAGVLVRLIGGVSADRLRRPKAIALGGYGLSAACKALMLSVSGFLGLSAVIALDRAGKGLRTGPRDAMIAGASAPGILGRAFGVHRALDTFGALLGPLVAWGLLSMAPGDFDMVFVASLCFAAMGVVILGLLVPEQGEAPSMPSQPVEWRAVFALLRNPGYRRVLACAGALALATIGDGFLYLALLRTEAITATTFPLLFIGTSAAYLALAVPLGRLADRIGRLRVFLFGYALLLGAYLAAGFWSSGLGVVSCLALLGAYYAATDGVLPAAAAPLAPAELRGTAISAVQTAVAFGRAVGAVVFGTLWTAYSSQTGLWVFSGALGCGLLLAGFKLMKAAPEEEA